MANLPAVPPKRQGAKAQHTAGPKQPAKTRPANPAPKKAAPKPVRKAAATVAKRTPAGSTVKAVSGAAVKGAKKAHGASFDSKFAPRQRPIKSVITYRHVIAAEFWIGLILIFTKPRPDQSEHGAAVTGDDLIEAAAFILVWAILFGVTAGGRNAARVATGFSTLIVLTIATQQSKAGRWKKYQTPGDINYGPGIPGAPGSDPNKHSQAGQGLG